MLEPQDHSPQLLFDDPSFDTDALSAATLLGIGRTRLSQITSAGSLPYLRRKVGDRFRVFYRRSDLEKRIALRYAFAHSSIAPGADKQIPAVDGEHPLRVGASVGADFGAAEYETSDTSAATTTTPLFQHAAPIRHRFSTTGSPPRRAFVAATKLQHEEDLAATLARVELSLMDLKQQIRNIEDSHSRMQDDALQTKREHQRELHLLARLIRVGGAQSPRDALTIAQDLPIRETCSPTRQQKAKRARLRARALKRLPPSPKLKAGGKKRPRKVSE